MRRLSLLVAIGALLLPSTASAETATSYCLHGTMADGTWTRPGSLAHNSYRLGTRLWAHPAVFGRHRWTVRDRIGWGTEADFWTGACSRAVRFGRRHIRLTIGWHHRHRYHH